MLEIISYEHALQEELLFEMANVSRDSTGLPYELWIDSVGIDRNNKHHEPRVKINVKGSLIPVIISDNPDVPESVKKQGLNSIPKFAHIQKYIRAYRKILLAHFNKEISDKDALNLLGPIQDAKKAELKLSEMKSFGDTVIEFQWLPNEELYVIEVRNDIERIASAQALTDSELFGEIARLQNRFGSTKVIDKDNHFSQNN